MSKPPANPENAKTVFVTNRKARFEYHISDKIEAGIELKGTEVKSIRNTQVSIAEAFVMFEKGQAILHKMRVEPYTHGNQFNHEPSRPRRLLMHRVEIDRLEHQLATKGVTIVPLRLYARRGKIKIELGIGKGKSAPDKRESIKQRESDRDARRAIARET